MARGFDGTYNNRLERALTAVSDYPMSVHCLANIQGGTGTKSAFSIGDKDRNNYLFSLDASDNGDGTHNLTASRTFFSSASNNTGVAQSEGVWFGFGAAADAANVNAYVDGTEYAAALSSGTGVHIDEVVVGNLARSSHSQAWNGYVAECAVWAAFLDADDFSALGRGVSPLLVRPQDLVFYAPLVRDEDDDLLGGGGLTVVVGATIEDHPPVFRPRRHDYGLPGVSGGGLTANPALETATPGSLTLADHAAPVTAVEIVTAGALTAADRIAPSPAAETAVPGTLTVSDRVAPATALETATPAGQVLADRLAWQTALETATAFKLSTGGLVPETAAETAVPGMVARTDVLAPTTATEAAAAHAQPLADSIVPVAALETADALKLGLGGLIPISAQEDATPGSLILADHAAAIVAQESAAPGATALSDRLAWISAEEKVAATILDPLETPAARTRTVGARIALSVAAPDRTRVVTV